VSYARTPIPAEGDRIQVPVLRGYTLEQDRPMACRTYGQYANGSYGWGCKCGECHGNTILYPGTVERVVYYADNSTEVEVLCDDGTRRITQPVPPHGDVCF
jgi:hypothetical protein